MIRMVLPDEDAHLVAEGLRLIDAQARAGSGAGSRAGELARRIGEALALAEEAEEDVPDDEFEVEEHQTGFCWGPVTVTRVMSGRFGVVLDVRTEHRRIEVRATPAGRKLMVYERE